MVAISRCIVKYCAPQIIAGCEEMRLYPAPSSLYRSHTAPHAGTGDVTAAFMSVETRKQAPTGVWVRFSPDQAPHSMLYSPHSTGRSAAYVPAAVFAAARKPAVMTLLLLLAV